MFYTRKQMIISQKIEELIVLNIGIWHEASRIKDYDNKPIGGLDSETRVKHFLKIRELNAKRSETRAIIDKYFNDGVDETKTNYIKAQEE